MNQVSYHISSTSHLQYSLAQKECQNRIQQPEMNRPPPHSGAGAALVGWQSRTTQASQLAKMAHGIMNNAMILRQPLDRTDLQTLQSFRDEAAMANGQSEFVQNTVNRAREYLQGGPNFLEYGPYEIDDRLSGGTYMSYPASLLEVWDKVLDRYESGIPMHKWHADELHKVIKYHDEHPGERLDPSLQLLLKNARRLLMPESPVLAQLDPSSIMAAGAARHMREHAQLRDRLIEAMNKAMINRSTLDQAGRELLAQYLEGGVQDDDANVVRRAYDYARDEYHTEFGIFGHRDHRTGEYVAIQKVTDEGIGIWGILLEKLYYGTPIDDIHMHDIQAVIAYHDGDPAVRRNKKLSEFVAYAKWVLGSLSQGTGSSSSAAAASSSSSSSSSAAAAAASHRRIASEQGERYNRIHQANIKRESQGGPAASTLALAAFRPVKAEDQQIRSMKQEQVKRETEAAAAASATGGMYPRQRGVPAEEQETSSEPDEEEPDAAEVARMRTLQNTARAAMSDNKGYITFLMDAASYLNRSLFEFEKEHLKKYLSAVHISGTDIWPDTTQRVYTHLYAPANIVPVFDSTPHGRQRRYWAPTDQMVQFWKQAMKQLEQRRAVDPAILQHIADAVEYWSGYDMAPASVRDFIVEYSASATKITWSDLTNPVYAATMERRSQEEWNMRDVNPPENRREASWSRPPPGMGVPAAAFSSSAAAASVYPRLDAAPAAAVMRHKRQVYEGANDMTEEEEWEMFKKQRRSQDASSSSSASGAPRFNLSAPSSRPMYSSLSRQAAAPRTTPYTYASPETEPRISAEDVEVYEPPPEVPGYLRLGVTGASVLAKGVASSVAQGARNGAGKFRSLAAGFDINSIAVASTGTLKTVGAMATAGVVRSAVTHSLSHVMPKGAASIVGSAAGLVAGIAARNRMMQQTDSEMQEAMKAAVEEEPAAAAAAPRPLMPGRGHRMDQPSRSGGFDAMLENAIRESDEAKRLKKQKEAEALARGKKQ
jgi:hypothetical protein